MLSHSNFHSTFLFVIVLLLGAAFAQSNADSCFDNDFTHTNASATTLIQELQAGSRQPQNWTVGTAVIQVVNQARNASVVKQNFWLKTNPLITNATGDLSYGGCVVYYPQTLDSSTYKLDTRNLNTADTSGQCSNVLPKGCNDALMEQFRKSIVLGYGMGAVLNDTRAMCEGLNTTLPNECASAGFGASSQTMAGPFGLAHWTEEGAGGIECNNTNPFDGSPTKNWFYYDDSTYHRRASSINDQQVYDYFVKRMNTIAFVTWPKNPTTAWSPEVASVCLSAQQNVESGSRIPTSGAVQLSSPWNLVLASAFSILFSMTLM